MNCQFFAAEANGDITISVHNNNLTVSIYGGTLSIGDACNVATICLDKNTNPVDAAKDLAHKLSIELGLRFTFGEEAYNNFHSRGERI